MRSTNLKIILLLFSFLIFFSCHNEEEYQDYQSKEKSALIKSQERYNSEDIQNWLKSQNIDLDDKILWDMALIYSKNINGSIIIDIPVKREESIFLEKLIFTVNNNDILGQLWTFRSDEPFLLDYEESYKLTAHDITRNFEGELIKYNLIDKKVKIVNNIQLKTYDYPSYASVCGSCHFNGGSPIEIPEVIIDSPQNGGIGWDYDWDSYWDENYTPPIPSFSTTLPGENINNLVPDCESFKFQNATSLWQEAAVKNIHFKIYLIDEDGIKYQYYISYPQAMSFGMGRNLVVGNTNITPGVAASIAATAVKNAMDETVDEYGNSDASEMTVSDYFLNRLENIFENMVPGAKFQSNYYSQGIIPSEYETNFFGIGDCN